MQTQMLVRNRPTARLFQRPPHRSVLTELAGMLDLRPAQAMMLGSSRVFPAASGMAWRLQFDDSPLRGRSRPCVVLPVAASDLAGAAVVRLLSAQAQLLSQYSLYVGVSPEGWIEFTTLQWYDRANELLSMLEQTLRTVSGLLHALSQDAR